MSLWPKLEIKLALTPGSGVRERLIEHRLQLLQLKKFFLHGCCNFCKYFGLIFLSALLMFSSRPWRMKYYFPSECAYLKHHCKNISIKFPEIPRKSNQPKFRVSWGPVTVWPSSLSAWQSYRVERPIFFSRKYHSNISYFKNGSLLVL